jgi:hypothetical protein
MVFLALLTLYLVCGALVTAVILQDRAKGRGRATPRMSANRSPAVHDATRDPRATHARDLVFHTQG